MNDKLLYFKNELETNVFSTVNDFYDKFKKNKDIEFEISFKNISIVNYKRIVEHLLPFYDDKHITFTKSLDINIGLDNNKTLRATLNGSDAIDKYIENISNSKNIVDFFKNSKTPDVTFMYKSRDKDSIIFIDIFDISIKSIKEDKITSFPKEIKSNSIRTILYRYKERVSFNDGNAVIDITEVNQTQNLFDIYSDLKNYEVELELINKNIKIDKMFELFYNMLTVVQNSVLPISKSESKYVIDNYYKILDLKKSSHLAVRNVVSIDKNAVVNHIPNKYAVVDKSDGDRFFLIILERGVYLISTNMKVQKTDIVVKCEKYYNTILDGELISLENLNRMFLVFDVVYSNKIDYRYVSNDLSYDNKNNLNTRINVYKNIISECFKTQINVVDYMDKNTDVDLNKIKKFYQNELQNYWKKINNLIENSKNKVIIIGKNYFIPYGFDKSEIYMYANLIYQMYTYEKLIPYKLDGMIYTPLNISYTVNNNNSQIEYKWKKYTENSIDFYIIIEKDENGNDVIFSSEKTPNKNTQYKICNLYVGKSSENGGEKPILFKIDNVGQKAYVKIDDGEIRDIEHNIINDCTVVEFYYDIHLTNVDVFYKWIPMRTRLDKTESVLKYNKRYGNNVNVANNIWKTIVDPITEEQISLLGNSDTYSTEISKLKADLFENRSNTNVYYQKKTADVSGMRAFNNWIKNNMIETYCTSRSSVLDIGCGRGGDLIKFINAGISEYVGVDIDYNGLFGITDCAVNRYNHFKSTLKNVPDMRFICADARGLFDSKSQENIFKRMSSTNKELIDKYLSGKKKYDIINCQFSMHYYLTDQLSWNNFMTNLDNHLNDNGYFIMTCFDGDKIKKNLFNKTSLSSSYTNDKGEKNIMFEIKKLYDDNTTNNIGVAIDLYNSIISHEGIYNTEYLVYYDFLNNEMKEKCRMDLVESDTFESIFNCYLNYFNDSNSYIKSNIMTFKKFNEIHNFYKMLNNKNQNIYSQSEIEIAKASFDFAMLYRYYVYKRYKSVSINKTARLVGLNGNIHVGNILTPHFKRKQIKINPSQKTKNITDLYKHITKNTVNLPSIYLIRHNNIDIKIKNKSIEKSQFDFLKIKNGYKGGAIIYKSPDKYFYPIGKETPNGINYVFTSKKCINDLNMMVNLSNTFY